jgi:hypothetical protein
MVGLGITLLLVVGWQSLRVRQENRAILAAIERSRASAVSPGDWIGELAGISPKHHNLTRYQTAEGLTASLIIAMSVDCGFCDENLDSWQRLSSQARQSGMQVVWVSRDSIRRASLVGGLDESLIAEPTHTTYVQLKLSTVPQTVVVQHNGTVTYAHAGVLRALVEQHIAKMIADVAAR